jgi:hypothetical protein
MWAFLLLHSGLAKLFNLLLFTAAGGQTQENPLDKDYHCAVKWRRHVHNSAPFYFQAKQKPQE